MEREQRWRCEVSVSDAEARGRKAQVVGVSKVLSATDVRAGRQSNLDNMYEQARHGRAFL